MSIDIRQAAHPDDVRFYDSEELRRHFLIEKVFVPGDIRLTYSHLDRMVVGGAVPTNAPLVLEAPKPIGQASFLARREIGIFNLGGLGRVRVGTESYELGLRDCLYAGMGAGEVTFESVDAGAPAKFYLLSTPAHAAHPTKLIRPAEARQFSPGEPKTANKRNVSQYILPGVCDSCQLVMGLTELAPGNVWNTMPTHTHDRRSEAYFYFTLPDDQRIIHLMGEPDETRHLVVANEQAILSPNWSIHSGVGTSAYAFIWGMGGDNMDYVDMDQVAMDQLR